MVCGCFEASDLQDIMNIDSIINPAKNTLGQNLVLLPGGYALT